MYFNPRYPDKGLLPTVKHDTYHSISSLFDQRAWIDNLHLKALRYVRPAANLCVLTTY